MSNTQQADSESVDGDIAELMTRCRHGDASAWSAIVNRYERLVFAIPVREGLGREDAADVTQETFTALVRNLDKIEEPERLGSWLMTVARRKTWRVRGRAETRSSYDVVEGMSATDLSDDAIHALWIYEAIQQLDEPCRSLILSLYFDPDSPSYGEIAVALGRPLGSIGPLRSRCLDRLAAILGEP